SPSVKDGHAVRVLELLSQPELRIDSITIDPFTDPGLFEQVLTRDFGDRITVRIPVLGRATPIERDVYIRGVEHTFDAVSPWWLTKWTLADAERFDNVAS